MVYHISLLINLFLAGFPRLFYFSIVPAVSALYLSIYCIYTYYLILATKRPKLQQNDLLKKIKR